MFVDHVIEIGATHEMCQDYALSGKINDNISFAVVSDGCSASRNVDIGARLLCYAVKKFLSNALRPEESVKSILEDVDGFKADMWNYALIGAQQLLHSIDLDLAREMMALDCTLLVAVCDQTHAVTFQEGDGGVIVQNRDFTSFKHIEFKSGAPYYLSYELDTQRNIGYLGQFGGAPVIVWNDEIKDGVVLRNIGARFDELDPEKLSNHTATVWENPLGVTLVSDGVMSFQSKVSKKDWKNLTFEEIVPKLVKYKNFNGQFVQRRYNGFKQFMNKEHEEWRHYDDLAIASIRRVKL